MDEGKKERKMRLDGSKCSRVYRGEGGTERGGQEERLFEGAI